MEITPRELRDVEIKEGIRGYNRDAVNDLLEQAAATLDSRDERIRQLTEALSSAQTEAGRTRETEDILHRTLVLAQRAADEAVAEAQAKARQMIDEADIQSRRTLDEAEAEGRRQGEAERRRLEEEVIDLASRRDALLADVEAFSRFEAEYRERMQRALEADLAALRSRPSSAPGARPEVSDVEVPALADVGRRDATASSDESEPEPESEAASASEVETVGVSESASADTPAPMSTAAPEAPASAPDAKASPPASPAYNTVPSASTAPDPPTSEVDMGSLFEEHAGAPTDTAAANGVASEPASPSAVAATATSAPADAPSRENPIDLLGEDALDAEVLDDDAFFATLREAVHDESPLGPREESDDRTFFDAEDEDRSSFRDVFRRRR